MDVDENLELREIKLKQDNVVGKRVDEINLAGDARIFLIQRKDDIFVPDNGTVLKANDTITLIGEGEEVEKSMDLFQS
jgi:Trk K+ transport system NAD-binding subunit